MILEVFNKYSLVLQVNSFTKDYKASLAQLVEQRTFNPKVVGSIPTWRTKTGYVTQWSE